MTSFVETNPELVSQVTGALALGFAAAGQAEVAAPLAYASAATAALAAADNAAHGRWVDAALDGLGAVAGAGGELSRLVADRAFDEAIESVDANGFLSGFARYEEAEKVARS